VARCHALERRIGTAAAQIDTGQLDQIGQAAPVALESRMRQFQQERRGSGAALFDT
jgi:hypothetical protein